MLTSYVAKNKLLLIHFTLIMKKFKREAVTIPERIYGWFKSMVKGFVYCVIVQEMESKKSVPCKLVPLF